MIGLRADGKGFIIGIEVEIFELILFRRFIRDRWWVFFQFPIFESLIRESKDLIRNGGIEDDFMKCLTLVDNLRNFLSPFFTDDMNSIEVHLRISLIINIRKLRNGISPGVFFLMPLNGIHLYHLIRALPEDIDPGVVINGHDDSQLEVVLSTLLVAGELELWDLEGFLDFARFTNLPAVQYLYLLLLQIRGDDSDVVLVCFNMLNYLLQVVWWHHFWFFGVYYMECSHPKYNG